MSPSPRLGALLIGGGRLQVSTLGHKGEGEGKGEGKREEGKGQRRGVGGVHEGGALGLAGAWLAQVGQAALRVVGVDITTAWLERGRRALALGGAPPAFVAHVLFGW